jgi:AraC family transcriptional regulator of adaptative response/methylated-DNA-[protein]-cysteine methyltransferase
MLKTRDSKERFDVDLANRLARFIQDSPAEAPTLDDMSAEFNVSPFHLQRTFKRVVGITPRQYADYNRLEDLKCRLREGENVTNAMYNAGYGSSSRLYESAPERLGMTPATYSKGGEGMYIHYAIVDCHLGRILVGMTERGICAVHIGGNDAELLAVLHREYPAAIIEESAREACEWVRALLEVIKGARPHSDLPLDIQGTAFQWKVWTALLEIPYGETRTYGEIAAMIGHPKAARAVAEAVNANRAAVIIPCHRAECKDGKATKYYSERSVRNKKALLEYEHQRPPQD